MKILKYSSGLHPSERLFGEQCSPSEMTPKQAFTEFGIRLKDASDKANHPTNKQDRHFYVRAAFNLLRNTSKLEYPLFCETEQLLNEWARYCDAELNKSESSGDLRKQIRAAQRDYAK